MSPQPRPSAPPPAPRPPAGPSPSSPPAGPKVDVLSDQDLLLLFRMLPVGLLAVLLIVIAFTGTGLN